MRYKYEAMLFKIQSILHNFLSTKTIREKYLLCIAVILCITFVILDFVYLPLLKHHSELKSLHTNMLQDVVNSPDSMENAKSLQLEQIHSLHSKLHSLEQNLAIIQNYVDTQETHFNPFNTMSSIISFSKERELTLTSFVPYPSLDALSIEGIGDFYEIIALLTYIESHHFLSLETLSLSPKDAQIHFNILIIDHRLNPNKIGKL